MTELGSEPCPKQCGLADALEAVGERWSFLILLGAFKGLGHFEQFQSTLGIARNILSDRLTRLTEHDILARIPSQADRRRIDYRLTAKGAALMPALIALHQWGERWGNGGPTNPVPVDAKGLRPVRPVVVQAADGRVVTGDDVRWVDRVLLDEPSFRPATVPDATYS